METDAPQTARRALTFAALTPVLGVVGIFSCCFGSCGANFYYMISAPPLVKTVALVESNDAVGQALGNDVDVSLAVTRTLERDFIRRGGRDRVYVVTTVDGSSGEALLDVDAVNVDGQGWAGRFSVRTLGRQVLVNGSYTAQGGGTVLEGTFAPDGTPIVVGE